MNTADTSLVNIEMGTQEGAAAALAAGKVFQGGNWNHLHRMLRLRTGSQLLYVGDHMYSDILRSKRTLGWRTVLIVPELLHEVNTLENGAEQRHYLTQLRASRAEVDRELRRVQLKRLQLLQSVQAAQENESDLAAGQEGGNSDAGSARLALSAVNDEHDELLSQQKWLSAQLGDALSASHTTPTLGSSVKP